MGTTQTNTEYKKTIAVTNYDGSTISGLTSSNFSISYTKDNIAYTDSITDNITEVGSTSNYTITTTFPSTGFWVVKVDVSNSTEIFETHRFNVNVSDISGDSIYTSSLANTVAMTQNVGGLSSGTTVGTLSNGTRTVSQVLDSLLFPTAYPTYTQPSCNLSDNVANLQTVGSSINITLNTTANRGTINTSWDPGSQGAFAGVVTNASVSGPGGPYTPLVNSATDIDDISITGHIVTEGSNSWTLTVTFDDGVDPLDSTGEVVAGAAYVSATKSNSTSFEGVYPIILGTSANLFTNRALVSHSANNIQLSQPYDETTTIRHRIKIPTDMINSRAVTMQIWNSVASIYESLNASEFTVSSDTVTIEGLPVGYTVYTKAGSIGGGDVSGQPIYRVRFG